MANQPITRQEVTREALMILRNNLKILPNFYRDLDKEFGKAGGKIGDTIMVRKPSRFIGRDGQRYNPEPLIDNAVPISITQQSGVDFEFSTAEKFLSLDYISKRYIKPATISLANKLDLRAGQVAMVNTFNHVGTPGVTPGMNGNNAFLTYAQAGAKLDDLGFPLTGNDRAMIMTPTMRVGFADFAKGFYNPGKQVNDMWKKGQVSDLLDYRWYVDQNVPVQTIGALGGTPAVTGAGQTGTSLNISGLTANTAGVFNVGDILSINGVFAVNPQSRQSTGSLQQFVVQATADADGAGTASLTIFPAIVPSGQYQNVSATPANGALIRVYDITAAGQSGIAGISTPQGLLFNDQAFAFVSFPGDVPNGKDEAHEERDEEIGVSLRYIRDMDTKEDEWINRFDVYYGMGPLYAEASVRVSA